MGQGTHAHLSIKDLQGDLDQNRISRQIRRIVLAWRPNRNGESKFPLAYAPPPGVTSAISSPGTTTAPALEAACLNLEDARDLLAKDSGNTERSRVHPIRPIN